MVSVRQWRKKKVAMGTQLRQGQNKKKKRKKKEKEKKHPLTEDRKLKIKKDISNLTHHPRAIAKLNLESGSTKGPKGNPHYLVSRTRHLKAKR